MLDDMKRHCLLLASVALGVALWSCIDDPIYDTSHPDTGKIAFTIDFSGRTDGVATPETVTARVGQYSASLATGAPIAFPNLLQPGVCHANLYNTADKITVEGPTASVAAAASPSIPGQTFADPLPGWLFTCALDQTIEKDKDYDITALMVQQVRQLTITLNVTGGDPARITAVSAVLTGVAGSVNIDTGVPQGIPVNVAPAFTRTDARLSATVRLLGVTGPQQKLTVTLTFSDGTATTQTIETDLTTQLAGFNADKKTPLTLTGTLETPVKAGFTATITDWKAVDGGSYIIK